jgi:hypothetical protein
LITQGQVREALDYDPKTGVFTWRYRESQPPQWSSQFVGKRAGSLKSHGYRYISIKNTRHAEHRLVWLYVYGSLPGPGLHVDHINGQRDDNRLKNLRVLPRADNLVNCGPSSRNTSGVKGVGWNKKEKKWQAYICRHRKQIHLGWFSDFDDAAKARRKAEKSIQGKFARTA